MSNIAIYDPDAVVANQVQQYLESVNTPDYDSQPHKIINPDLTGLTGMEMRYWKAVTGIGLTGMGSSEIAAVDESILESTRQTRREYLKTRGDSFLTEQSYDKAERHFLDMMYTEGVRARANQQAYVSSYVYWERSVNNEIASKIGQVDSESSITGIEGITIDETGLYNTKPAISSLTGLQISDSQVLIDYLDSNTAVTGMSGDTGIIGPYYLIELLNHRKDLYNDSENPLYTQGHQPILGESGSMVETQNRVLNLETIHGKGGWHRQNVTAANYTRPRDLLIYYGWLNSFNSGDNSWNNELVAQDMAKYQLLVFGDGIQDPGHGDYSNAEVIIPRIKELNPNALIFGYVTANQSLANFKTKAGQWDDLEVHGIFMDESGYDYGKTRSEFNERVDYVHAQTYASLCFANAWNTNHILGTANDPSYPNSTYNSSGAESNLTENDWILLESFPINTTAYSGSNGVESKSDWSSRGSTMQSLRYTYNVNFSGSGIINNDNANGTCLADFGFISSLMWSLEGWGTSDTSYGASSATVIYWTRPDVTRVGKIWSLSTTVTADVGDADVYWRYGEFARYKLDFSSGGETGAILTW